MLISMSVCFCTTAWANPYFQRDTTKRQKISDTLKFPIEDRRGDFLTNTERNPFNLRDPINIKDSIEYDPKTNQYYIVEKVGNRYFRKPTYLTFEEFMNLTSQKSESDYFRQRADMLSALNRKKPKPKLTITDNLFNRLFGNGKVDIRPQGNVDILAGYQGQNVQNPTLPENARRTGGLDFNMDANVNVVGNIGSKLKLPITYNTQATFDWMNQLKLEYTGGPDDIVKKIEAGNTSFTTKSALMSSQQSLFGIKTQLQFGKLFVTGVLANQRSQSQSLALQGGSATTTYQFKADDYDENRHFLLAKYFRDNYNKAMKNLPIVNSAVQILRIEVWVTNRNGATVQARGIVGLMDLGEASPYNTNIHSTASVIYPYNDANDVYRNIINDPASRVSSQVINKLTSLGLTQVQDYEQVFARKLNATDYTFNPQVGFISLNQPLQPNDVLAVAYQYSYNGRIFQVGEFSQDVPPDTTLGSNPGAQKVLYLKLLKATSQRTNLPIWNLMMKNIYTLKTGTGSYLSNIQQTGFQLNVLYDEPSKGTKRYLPAGDKAGVPLLTVLNLDRLNAHNDPQPDGVFDYLEGFTVVSSQARVIFPVLEPFGRDLDTLAFSGSQAIKNNYVFFQLYDTIKEVARTYANVDRYWLGGVAKGQTATSDVALGAFNVPPGSVTVTAGGQRLRENIDYVVDYNLGSVKIINQAIINSGIPVNVQYENNASFGTQQRGFLGLRLDYLAKNTPTTSLAFGGTIERLNERPFFTKTNYNEDPIRNTMYGADASYRSQVPEITRLLNKLPFYSSKEMSTITAVGEAAFLKPGHPPQIGRGSNGTIYIDDFEGSTSSIDLRFPLTSWALASTPQNNGLFPEGSLNDSLDYGFNRAKIAWYNIEPTLQDRSNTNNPVRSYQDFSDPRITSITVQQLFPQQTPEFGQAQLITFDVAYYPTDRGPYNFDARPGSVLPTGKLANPQKRWGGIMRSIDQTDFETSNVQYIEFWMQSPFLGVNTGSSGGQMYLDLGSISEDILKDGRRMFENGLNTPNIPAAIDSSSVWGRVPANPIQVTNAFSNDPSDRPYQDEGFDGLDDPGEQTKFQNYLSKLAATFGTGSAIYQKALQDPSDDDFLNYRDPSYDAARADILGRYKNVNNPQGNSPIATPGQQFVNAFTLYPDQEDLDHDNTLNELEEYFEYKVNLTPAALNVGSNFITDRRDFTPSGGQPQTWFQFRIPINSYNQKVGNIPDFKSIRFIRMYLTGFTDSVVCRFAEFQFIRDQWRIFNYQIDTTGNYTLLPTPSNTNFNVTAVNIEQNSTRTPIPYVIPPGIQRQQQLSTNNVNLLLNEQAMSLQVCNLGLQDTRGVFKNVNMDLRRFGKMDMFIHAEWSGPTDMLNDYDLNAVIRLGSDFINNYYEVKIPLRKTKFGATIDTDIWPESNNLNLDLNRLISLKVDRNNRGSSNVYFKEIDSATGRSYAVFGNPNLGQVQAFFLGVQNARQQSVCTEVWFDELRLSEINDQGGYAATGRVDIKLADLGSVYVSGAIRTVGFGTLDQNINARSFNNTTQVDAATSLELGRLLPRRAGISLPFYGSISKSVSTPEFDPYDLDIKLNDKLKAAPANKRDSIKQQAIDEITIKSFNFTNVRKVNLRGKRLKLWSLENFDFSYSYTKSEHHSPIAEEDELINYKGGLGYNFAGLPKYWEPFKRSLRNKSAWFGLIRDFNLNPVPTIISFRADISRQFGAYRSRNIDGPKGVLPETYNKFFTFDRSYVLRWDITRSINIDFSAINRAWVDEDSGRLDKEGRKKMWDNFWKGGRTVLYTQTANATYTLPTNKLPLIDWTTVRLGYGSSYTWTTASLLAKSLGNSIQNTQKKDLTSELNFSRLYSKWKLLRDLDQSSNYPSGQGGKKITDTAKHKQSIEETNQPYQLKGFVKFLAHLITALKDVNITYSENSASSIFGYMDSTTFLGMNLKSGEPGLGYVFGQQPDTNFVNHLGRKGLLTTDTTFNFQNLAMYTQLLNIAAQLQPIRDLNITININKTFGKNYSELYKDTSGGKFARLNPYTAGTFSISFISISTLFESFAPNTITKTFRTFEENRLIISARLGKQNPYSGGIQNQEGYYKGYGKYAQDVLIPAFIAAYSGKSANSIALINNQNTNIKFNPFSGYLPKPNWRISYNGLSRIPGMDKIFSNFSITNGYTSTLSMNSFNSSLTYQDPLGIRQPGFIDTLTGNFVPYFLVPNITISEQFSPLIDLDMQFVNQLQLRTGYSRSRQLSLSLIDYQMSESRSTEFTVGFGYRKRGLPLPFGIKLRGKNGSLSGRLDNDLTIRLDYSLRDDATSNSYLDQNASLPVGGQRVIDIAPSIDYVINNRINIKFYFDRRRVEPKISSSPPMTTTRAGIQVRISLAEMANPPSKPK
ncbi:MAG: cell surface protein SprA [Bacteroidetes bacterium]|nr:MAG: cell surface protein SprA [Bacteroidota bacterium]